MFRWTLLRMRQERRAYTFGVHFDHKGIVKVYIHPLHLVFPCQSQVVDHTCLSWGWDWRGKVEATKYTYASLLYPLASSQVGEHYLWEEKGFLHIRQVLNSVCFWMEPIREKVHGLYTFNLFVSWCAANSSLGSKVNSQLESSKIQDQKKSLCQLGMDAGLLLALGIRIELPGRGIKFKKRPEFSKPWGVKLFIQ